ncbi:cytochrome oxidase small assembly protein [Glaciimonas sp. GG7]
MSDRKKPNNLRTAFLLASIALVFFVGIIVNRVWFN